MLKSDYALIGIVLKTIGLKGEIKIKSYSDFNAQRYKKKKIIVINEQEYTISEVRSYNGFIYLKLLDIDTIEKAKVFHSQQIYALKEDVKLKKKQFHYSDLLDCSVTCLGEDLGKVVGFKDDTPQVLLKIEGNKNFYFPFVKTLLKKVDIENKVIEIKYLKGLYD